MSVSIKTPRQEEVLRESYLRQHYMTTYRKLLPAVREHWKAKSMDGFKEIVEPTPKKKGWL